MVKNKKKGRNNKEKLLPNKFRNLSNQIIRKTSQELTRVNFLKEVSELLQKFSHCDVLELWLKRLHDKKNCEVIIANESESSYNLFPCFLHAKFDSLTISHARLPSIKFCRNVILGNFDNSLPFITESGTFWLNDPSAPENKQKLEENYSLKSENGFLSHYGTVLILPLNTGEETIGLIQLKSKDKDLFTVNEVEMWEEFVQIFGIIILNQKHQAALQERVKELTCLYGISKIAEKPKISIPDILHGIVDLLPPAWQYPKYTCARIQFDDEEYTSPHFEEGKYKQTADLIIRGERRGQLEVIYIIEEPEMDEGPFLKEERDLINVISKQVSLIIERRIQAEEKEKLEEQLRHADRLATLGQLSAGVAHELNEPLGSILGFAQLIRKNDLSKQILSDLDKIIDSCLHAREVIKKLLIFSRQMPPQKTSVNINKIVEEGLYFLESRCAKNNIKVKRKLDKNLPDIYADASQLHQIVVNLVVNAIQSMHKGGELTISTKASDHMISLTVKDNGEGIAEENIDKIFNPFFTTKDIGEGTGIGLSVVHGIVKSHSGSISVASKLDEGTTFEVKLPVKEEETNE
ncbi:MAG: GHKL domain-containing protein [Candidatus Cloacimonetes bacterium]|nr:GHKL domain-containing protein [Candidatus Cloacimonadota bacterium]MBS3767398.1 GHKL domain-containing protein [Candidatus Cloacimonadota bacterium]